MKRLEIFKKNKFKKNRFYEDRNARNTETFQSKSKKYDKNFNHQYQVSKFFLVKVSFIVSEFVTIEKIYSRAS